MYALGLSSQKARQVWCSIVVLCLASSGCSLSSYGIKPDRNDFQKEGRTYCEKIHPGTDSASLEKQTACEDYEDAVRGAQALEKAYLTREQLNRWSLVVGVTIGLASVGALTGLNAFGQAGSDWAKIIPILGAFSGGLISYLSNDAKADAYEDARIELRAARTQAEATVSPNDQTAHDASRYNAAANALRQKVYEIELRLTQRVRAGRPAASESLQQIADLKKEKALLALAVKYRVGAVMANPAMTKIIVTLTGNIEEEDRKLMAESGVVRIDESDVKLTSDAIKDSEITVTIPDSIKGKPGSGKKVYVVVVKIGANQLGSGKPIDLTF
jgi:hypothetical protein